MRHACLIAFLLLAGASPSLSQAVQNVRGIDGDSLWLGGVEIRLWGINAPEWDQPGGQRAKAVLAALVAQGGALSCQSFYKDRYGRSVSRCLMADGRDLACEIIKSGSAHDYARYSKGYYRPCER